MKTIIHLELSDEERSDWAKRIHRDPNTKVLVTRKEVVETVLHLVAQEIIDGREIEMYGDEEPEVDKQPQSVNPKVDDSKAFRELIDETLPFKPSRGDESYLYKSKDPEMTKLCTAILDATDALDEYVWRALEENRA